MLLKSPIMLVPCALALALLLAGMLPAAAAGSDPGSASPAALAALGRRLFFDESLSSSGRLACASCHSPGRAYGPPPGRAIALGGADMRQSGTRAVPSLRYLRASPPFALDHRFIDGDIAPVGGFMWDGRAASIRDQARLPLLAANEMANGGPAEVVRRLRRSPNAAEFRAVFGAHALDVPDRAFGELLAALDAFQDTADFHPYTSRYDAYLRGEIELTPQEEHGVALFKDPKKGNCASCHLGTSRAGVPPAFNDFDYANVGVPRNPRIPANADPDHYDLGLCGPLRADLRDRREYCGFFRSPTLRNVAIRDAFFHNGVFGTLREVLHFYVERDLQPEKYYPRNADGSVHRFDDLPPDLSPVIDRDPPLDRTPGDMPALSDSEIDDLIAFLQTLNDADVQ